MFHCIMEGHNRIIATPIYHQYTLRLIVQWKDTTVSELHQYITNTHYVTLYNGRAQPYHIYTNISPIHITSHRVIEGHNRIIATPIYYQYTLCHIE